MRRSIRTSLGLLLASALFTPAHAVENTWEYAVQASASVQSSPARIALSWPQDVTNTPSSYTVYRKPPGATSWGTGTTLSGNATSYVDANVAPGNTYEYRIVKVTSGYTGYGYVQAGVEAPLVDHRGKVVLVVDNTMAAPLAGELARLEEDLRGDGWTVVRRDVGRNDSPASVKAVIKAAYEADPANVKSVFLFGHIPVPYSGQFNPDGHPDHVGAWPADVYYGDMDGAWTDSTVNYTQTLNTDKVDAARMSNFPGDGKFDQTNLPSSVELEVGRVDLANMPGRTTWGGPATFATETELLRKYLNKDHAFRHRVTNPARRAILGDYFGLRGGESFAASGARSFAALVGADNVRNLNREFNDQKGLWIPQTAAQDYLLAYGCGAGSYTTMAGLGATGLYNDGSTVEMVRENTRGVFNLLFGSWLGDWDHEDNFLRAPLANDHGLASAWSGRPHWFIHPMGTGETLGHVTRLAQNNNGLYQTQINTAQNRVHIALMGDPTLRLHPVAPVRNFAGSTSGGRASLTWSASVDSDVVGYHVYRAASASGAYTRLTSAPITATAFSDADTSTGATYMVRAVKLENTPSGSYFNASQGKFWTVGSNTATTAEAATANSTPAPSASTASATTAPVTTGASAPAASMPAMAASTTLVISSVTAPASSEGGENLPVVAALTVTPAAANSTAPAPATPSADTVWFDDALPDGSGGGARGGDAWTWVASGPTPFSGTVAHQSSLQSGIHEHFFANGATLGVGAGETLFVYVHLDPANPPSQIMVSWLGRDWEHRAYWGANRINAGSDNTASRYYAGALPMTGQWVRLEVPARAVGLEGETLHGMNFTLFDGRASWDKAGKTNAPLVSNPVPTTPPVTTTPPITTDPPATTTPPPVVTTPPPTTIPPPIVTTPPPLATPPPVVTTPPPVVTTPPPVVTTPPPVVTTPPPTTTTPPPVVTTPPPTTTTPPPTTTPPAPTETEFVYFDDALPAGASGFGNGGDSWNWVSANPTPFSGAKAHQSSLSSSIHEHAFGWGATMAVNTGDKLFAYVYLDPANPPAAIMVSWGANNWEHRAYWGADRIPYATKGTPGQYYVGPLPAAGQWVRLEVPASAVALEGQTVSGMAFTLSDGRATWDKTGKLTGGSSTITSPVATTPPPTTTTPTTTEPPPTTTTPPPVTTTPGTPGLATLENAAIRTPKVGENFLTIVSPTVLELRRITTKQPDPSTVNEWNFVSNGAFSAPSTGEFNVTVNGQAVSVKSVGFRRRVAYAPLDVRDLRIDNALYLELNSAIAADASVEVKNTSGALWPSSMQFAAKADSLRYSPAIHVNQEGYVPTFAKKAMVGLYLGSLGELNVDPSVGFKLVSAATGATVHTGSLTLRRETGFIYTPLPYQKVYEADFSGFTATGEYQLVVPGLGASLPFLINDGVAMGFARTYAAGLYHQRCGHSNALPFTRHEHGACHLAAAEVPVPQSSYSFTWNTIASKNGDAKNNPRHTAPQLRDEASMLYPYVNRSPIDLKGGHHDAGDYSKYTINVAFLTHTLVFTADAIAGAGDLDNLGIPESGDGRSDILQEAKQESDFLAKMQDSDGGFYFLVYPKNRAYEGDVMPDRGDQQVVWPKTTAVTAASVAALAQTASSPKFKAAYPAEAAAYLAKAKLGWQFLMNAIARYGKDGSYQKITHYGAEFMHDDELAWAACEMFLATGEAQYHQKLMEWFPNPADQNTMRWTWWRLYEGYGHAIRSYAFGARSGRVSASQLDAAYLAKCEEQIRLSADDVLKWSNSSAYGTSLPEASRHVRSMGWFFSLDTAADMAVAYQLNPKPEYITALVGNMNYEAGTNPVNVTYLTGIGLKRQREVVSQYARNDRRALPPAGLPISSVTSSLPAHWFYAAQGNEMEKLSFPTDNNAASNFYPFYDRWTDTWNVSGEFVVTNQARGLLSSAFLAVQTASKSGAWKPSTQATIVITGTPRVGTPITLTLNAGGLDLTNARITWEAQGQQPDYGTSYIISPKNSGSNWAEAEILFPDGRRIFATGTFNVQ